MASVAPTSNGVAHQACLRCYKRKKRCDRQLPRCRPCAQAKVLCSFEQQSDETGVFPVGYVRGLEARVKKLEQELLKYQSAIANAAQAQDSPNGASDQNGQHSPNTLSSITVATPGQKHGRSILSPHSATPENLESDVKLLSLEATAERYLGSSSGVTFARLTQAVLKRLKPDTEPFSLTAGFRTEFMSQSSRLDKSNVSPSAAANETSNQDPSSSLALPAQDHAYRLTEYYWCHSHTLYPFLRQVWFMENLKQMYSDPSDESLSPSPSWLYTMWMVFAIGSTSLSSVMIADETESVQYWNEAMKYFEATLQDGNLTALSSIMLQVSYSFFNQVGPNTWYLVGMAIRIALGMGLHAKPPKTAPPLPRHVQEYRSRMFFSLYAMDRVISITLGRPFGLRDEDIEIPCFSAAEDSNILPDRILPHRQLTVPAIAVPLHIVALRKLSGNIFREVYSTHNSHLPQSEKDTIVRDLHERLIEWRRNMPFPLPDSRALRVPHLTTQWFDLNYHTHLIMIYRPSPLFPIITVEKVAIIADAAAMALRQMSIMRSNQSLSFNWLNLFSLFTMTLSLIYAITAQPQPLSQYLSNASALDDLRLAAELLETFGRKFPSALKYQTMVSDVIMRLESHLPPSEDRGSRLRGPAADSPLAIEGFSASGHGAARYPSHGQEKQSYPNLDQQSQLSLGFQLSNTHGSFDDFAAQDLVSGFDLAGSGMLGGEDEFFRFFNEEGNENA